MKPFTKDPQSVLDYQIDWSKWLRGDTIASSTWTVRAGITKTDEDFTDTTATIWLSGGTVGMSYLLTNTITTVGGRTDERSIQVIVRDR